MRPGKSQGGIGMNMNDWSTPIGVVIFFLGASTSAATLAIGLGYLLRSIAVLRAGVEKFEKDPA